MEDSTKQALEAYHKKKEELINELLLMQRHKQNDVTIGLGKSSSNLFRPRNRTKTRKIKVKNFNSVISIDDNNLIAEVEGMTTYEGLVRETLRHRLLPVVVPELKSITIGGAVAGGGIESSSFRYGLVHETIQEMEVLLSDGRTILCTPDGPYRDLFFGFPNSYGTLGYVLRVKVKLKRVKKYVRLTHTLYSDATRYMEDLKNICEQQRSKEEPVSFIDGTIFGPNELYLTLGTFVDEVPFTSNYKYMGIYYKSIQKKKTDYLTTPDYIWRWDPDWFWCSKCFFVQNPLVRLLFGKFCLKSTVYWKIRDFELKHRILEKIERFCGSKKRSEEVIQDVQIPIEHCVSFLDFFHKEIGIKPIWVCPTSASDKKDRYDLYLMDPSKLYINFGFWAVVNTPEKKEEGYFNKKVEQKVKELNGKKSLYSTSFYSYKEFWELYNKGAYDTLKVKYDPSNALGDLCEKSVKGR